MGESRRIKGFPVLSRGAVAGALIQVLSIGMAFVLRFALLRILGTAEYGLYIYAISWLDLLVIAATLGLDLALVRFVATYGSQQEWGLLRGLLRQANRAVLLVATLLGALVAAFGLVFRTQIGDAAALSCLVFLGLLPSVALVQLRSAVLRARRRVGWAISLLKLVRPVLLLAVLLLSTTALGLGRSGPGALICDLIAALATLAMGSWLVKRELPSEVASAKPENAPDWLRVGFSLLFASCMNILLNRTDVIMLGLFRDTTEAGMYEACSQIARLPLFGFTAIGVILAPMIAELFAEGRLDRLREVLRKAARGILLLAVLGVAGIVVLGQFALSLFDPTFASSYPALLCLAIGQLVSAAAGPVGFVLTMTGYEGVAGRVLLFAAVVNLALNALLIPHFGALGAAIATAVSISVLNIAMLVVTWKLLKIRPTAF